jgi:hypothetical protein
VKNNVSKISAEEAKLQNQEERWYLWLGLIVLVEPS